MGEVKIRNVATLLACGWLALGACRSESHSAQAGTETNWLRVCQEDSNCSVGDCVCGLCSEACEDDDDCPSGLRCEGESSALYRGSCGTDLEVHGLCAPECERDADCGAGLACDDGACAPEALQSAGDGGLPEPSGGQDEPIWSDGPFQLVTDAHLQQTPDCLPDLERPIASGAGTYDIAGGGFQETEGCRKPYRLSLRTRNLLDEDVLVTRVNVLLMSVQEQTIHFTQTNPPLANPFDVSITGSLPPATVDNGMGVIVAEVIPVDFALQLETFIGGQLLIRVQLLGETLDGTAVHGNVFEYRVELCYGCLTTCLTAVEDPAAALSGVCDDHAAADGRICLDPDC